MNTKGYCYPQSIILQVVYFKLTFSRQMRQSPLITNLHPVTLSKNFSKYFHCTIEEYKRRIKTE